MRKILSKCILVLLLCQVNSLIAQEYTFKNYKWEQKPEPFTAPEAYKKRK